MCLTIEQVMSVSKRDSYFVLLLNLKGALTVI